MVHLSNVHARESVAVVVEHQDARRVFDAARDGNVVLVGARKVGKTKFADAIKGTATDLPVLVLGARIPSVVDENAVVILDDFYQIFLQCLDGDDETIARNLGWLARLLERPKGVCVFTSVYAADWLVDQKLLSRLPGLSLDRAEDFSRRVKAFCQGAKRFSLVVSKKGAEAELSTNREISRLVLERGLSHRRALEACHLVYEFAARNLFGYKYESWLPNIFLLGSGLSVGYLGPLRSAMETGGGAITGDLLGRTGAKLALASKSLFSEPFAKTAFSAVMTSAAALAPVVIGMSLVSYVFGRRKAREGLGSPVETLFRDIRNASEPQLEIWERRFGLPPRSLEAFRQLLRNPEVLPELERGIARLESALPETKAAIAEVGSRFGDLEREFASVELEVGALRERVERIERTIGGRFEPYRILPCARFADAKQVVFRSLYLPGAEYVENAAIGNLPAVSGQRILVRGPPGSGKTSALVHLVERGIREQVWDWVVVLDPRTVQARHLELLIGSGEFQEGAVCVVWDDVHDMPDSSEVFACLGILLRFIEKAAPNSSLLVSCTAPSYFARLRGLAPVGFWQSQGFRELDLGRWGGPELARITEHVLSMQRPALSAVTKHVLVQTIVQRVQALDPVPLLAISIALSLVGPDQDDVFLLDQARGNVPESIVGIWGELFRRLSPEERMVMCVVSALAELLQPPRIEFLGHLCEVLGGVAPAGFQTALMSLQDARWLTIAVGHVQTHRLQLMAVGDLGDLREKVTDYLASKPLPVGLRLEQASALRSYAAHLFRIRWSQGDGRVDLRRIVRIQELASKLVPDDPMVLHDLAVGLAYLGYDRRALSMLHRSMTAAAGRGDDLAFAWAAFEKGAILRRRAYPTLTGFRRPPRNPGGKGRVRRANPARDLSGSLLSLNVALERRPEFPEALDERAKVRLFLGDANGSVVDSVSAGFAYIAAGPTLAEDVLSGTGAELCLLRAVALLRDEAGALSQSARLAGMIAVSWLASSRLVEAVAQSALEERDPTYGIEAKWPSGYSWASLDYLWHKYGNNIGVLEQASETDARARLALALLLLAPPHRDRPDIERARALLAGAQQGRVPLEDTKDAIYTQLLLRVQILLRVQMLIGALGREKSHMTAQRGRSPGA
ncbi:MAG: hypothetical protein A3K65_05360 [Euryarchaeota archaeon RBG_16_68_12]|nr:MAG: hypothetical protein A3K65_05360 [Euryarchaeota archaeon RBG_16_68_12]